MHQVGQSVGWWSTRDLVSKVKLIHTRAVALLSSADVLKTALFIATPPRFPNHKLSHTHNHTQHKHIYAQPPFYRSRLTLHHAIPYSLILP